MTTWLLWSDRLMVLVAVTLIVVAGIGASNGGATKMTPAVVTLSGIALGLFGQGWYLRDRLQRQRDRAITEAIKGHEKGCGLRVDVARVDERVKSLREENDRLDCLIEKLRRVNGRQQNT